MSKIKIVHYINNFFAGAGGEEAAGMKPEFHEGAIGPGLAFAKEFGDGYEIAATIVCGDNYFGEHLEEAKEEILNMMEPVCPQLFIAGPAFNAGRYGVACGTIAKAVEARFGIPVITGMYQENPGADMFKKDVIIVKTKNSAAGMRDAVPVMKRLGEKLINGEEIFGPEIEGYLERGIRVNYFHEKRGSERAVELLVKKMKGEECVTEYPMPVFDRVPPNPPVADVGKIKIAVVTSGGIVPQGNPDHIESSSATKYGIYSIKGMDHMDKKDFMTIHGGYDRAFVTEDPDLVVPLDVLREMEQEGVIGELADYFITTTGTGTSTGNAKAFGEDFVKKLLDDHIGAVILTST